MIIFKNGGSYRVRGFNFPAGDGDLDVYLVTGQRVTIKAGEASWVRRAEDTQVMVVEYPQPLLNNFKKAYFKGNKC